MSKMIKLNRQYFLGVILNILLSTFIFMFSPCMMAVSIEKGKDTLVDKIVAIVNDQVILQSEWDRSLKQIKRDMHNRGFRQPIKDEALKDKLLDFKIAEQLQLDLAEKQDIKISNNELSNALKELAKGHDLSLDKYKKSLEAEGVSFKEIEEQVRRELLIVRVQELNVAANIRVSPQEVKNYLDSPEGKRHLQYHLAHILIETPENAGSAGVKKAEQRAKAIYAKLTNNPDEFGNVAIEESKGQFALQGGDLGWRSASELPTLFVGIAEELKPGQISKPLHNPSGFHILKLIDVKNGSSHFQTQYHLRQIFIKPTTILSDVDAHETANTVYRKLKNKGDFAELARSFSDDNSASLNSGDLGWVTLDILDPALRETVENLPVGVISHPVKTSGGWHVIEVLGKRKKDVSEQLQKEQAHEILMKRKFQEELPRWINQLKSNAYIKKL